MKPEGSLLCLQESAFKVYNLCYKPHYLFLYAFIYAGTASRYLIPSVSIKYL
jgi:hypothetical protein